MKKLAHSLFLLPLLLAQMGLAQPTTTLTCHLQCNSKPNLYRFNGVGFEPFRTPTAINDSVFKFQVPQTQNPAFYYIGDGNNLRPLLLGTEKEVKLTGRCDAISAAALTNSPLNTAYDALKGKMTEFKNRTNLAVRKLRQVGFSNEELRAGVMQELRTLDADKKQFLDSLRKAQPFFAKIVALETYLSYDGLPDKSKYLNEVDYFATEFFQFADFKDKTYEDLPWVYEAFRNYAMTLTSVGLSDESVKEYLNRQVNKTPVGSRTRLMALSGIITILKQRNNSNFVPFADQFVAEFKGVLPEAAADLEEQVNLIRSFTIGGTAPDFAQATPEGSFLKLSDLRGKVVLVDFWASWCGPCRRENPHVVKLYQRYKAKGFEILGVSLDNDRNRWLAAIQQDGLTWYHVSDLKGWKNEVAQLYSVSSIPHTILLDKEGKILARNLRGAALEQKLAELFDN